MFVVEVIPMIKGPGVSSLTYFSRQKYPFGSIVNVPIRSKLKPALVIKATPASEQKTELRKASFSLQKLPDQTPLNTLPEATLRLAETLAERYPAHLSNLLVSLLPSEILTGEVSLHYQSLHRHEYDSTPEVLTATYQERLVAYRSRVRSALAHRGSIMIITPTTVSQQQLLKQIAIGIEDRVVMFSPHQSKRDRTEAYRKLEDTSLAKVIFTTPSHAALERVDLSSVIIEEEGNNLYRSQRRPYLDYREIIIESCRLSGRSLLLGDILPRSETEFRRRQDWYLTYDEPTKRLAFPTPLSVIEQKDRPASDVPFALFSKKLKKRLTETLSRPGQVFIYAARRGLAPVVACIDCGFIFRCPDSGTPYSLIKKVTSDGSDDRWLVSSVSGRKIKAPDLCEHCGSWRLRERGIGIQTVHQECLGLFAETPIFVFDSTIITTRKRAESLLAEFKKQKSAILIGTNLALPYLRELATDLAVVVSYDATRTIPTWQADEQTLRLLLTLRDTTKREVIVQCRYETDSVLTLADSGRIEDFYTDELYLRESLRYPPFSTFCLLTWQADPIAIKDTDRLVQTHLKSVEPDYYASPLTPKSEVVHHALIRLPTDKSKAELINRLRQLPSHIKVEMHPDRIV